MTSIYPQIIHHGGHQQVTGSCHELVVDDNNSILIDCGLTQGEVRREPEIEFPIDKIKALILTHVHIDHCGRLPYLIQAGFRGKVICSEPSALLLPMVMADALKIGFTRNRRLIDNFLKMIGSMLVALPYKKWHMVEFDGNDARLSVKLQRAGHILGSAYVETKWRRDMDEKRIVFSGDLGPPQYAIIASTKISL